MFWPYNIVVPIGKTIVSGAKKNLGSRSPNMAILTGQFLGSGTYNNILPIGQSLTLERDNIMIVLGLVSQALLSGVSNILICTSQTQVPWPYDNIFSRLVKPWHLKETILLLYRSQSAGSYHVEYFILLYILATTSCPRHIILPFLTGRTLASGTGNITRAT
jgi:hypothetical protein